MKKATIGILFALVTLKKLLTWAVAVLFIIYTVGVYDALKESETWLNRKTAVNLPSGVEKIYDYPTKKKDIGKVFDYLVFRFTDAQVEHGYDEKFRKGRKEKFEAEFLYDDATGVLSEKAGKEIPAEYVPDFQKQYWYFRAAAGVLFVYIPEDVQLFVLVKGAENGGAL